MKFVRTRKPRGIKLDGTPSFDFCTGCYSPYCDPFALSPLVQNKIRTRLQTGCCPACGKVWDYCSCHSTLDGKAHIVTHNNRKEKRIMEQKTKLCEQMTIIVRRLEQSDFVSDDTLLQFFQIYRRLNRFRHNENNEDVIAMIKQQMKLRDILRPDEIHSLGEILCFYLYNGT